LQDIWENRIEWIFYGSTVKRLAFTAAIFVFGMISGKLLLSPPSYSTQSSMDIKQILDSGLPSGAFQILPIEDRTDRIEIRFRTVQEHSFIGDLTHPDVQMVITYALMNDPRDNIRLKMVNILQQSPDLETVKEALIHAFEKDNNPGVRLKALDLLKTLPINEQLKKILVQSLFKDANEGVRVAAANTLFESKLPDIIPILKEMAITDDFVKALLLREGDIQSEPIRRLQ
jgi:hypothetical protein